MSNQPTLISNKLHSFRNFIQQVFGVNSIALGVNSKAYGDNSKDYGDRIHPYKKA